jgi:hypothetical protein
MADETVEIDVNVNTNAGQAEGNFTRLQSQIRETTRLLQAAEAAGDQAAFKQYKKNLDDLEDKLEITNLKQKQLDDTLAAAPGPLGKAGQAVKGLDGAFKFLIANPVVAIIAAIGSALMLMKKSLESTKEGQETLNRVSQAFSGILGPLLAIVEKVAVPVFNGFAFILEKVAAGFSKFASFLGISTSKIKEATLSVDKVQQDANKKEEDRQKEAQAAREKAEQERQQKAKEAAATRKQQQDDANKIILEAELSLLSDRDREVRERTIRYNEELKKLKLAGVKDLTKFEAEYRNDLAAINKKFDDEDKKRIEDKNKEVENNRKNELTKALATEKLALDLQKSQGLLTEDQYQSALFEIKKKYAVDAAALTQAEIENNNAVAASRKASNENQKKYIDDLAKKLVDAQNLQVDINKQISQSWIDLGQTIGSSFATLANLFEKGSAAQKVFGVASVIINAAQATAKILLDAKDNISAANKVIAQGAALKLQGAAVTATGFINPANFAIGAKMVAAGVGVSAGGAALLTKAKTSAAAQIAAVGITSGAQIAAILGAGRGSATSTTGAAGAAGGGAGGEGGAITIGSPSIGAPQIGATAAQSGTIAGIVAGTLQQNQSQGRPIRAYVVGNEITTQQQLERRIRTAARLGG